MSSSSRDFSDLMDWSGDLHSGPIGLPIVRFTNRQTKSIKSEKSRLEIDITF